VGVAAVQPGEQSPASAVGRRVEQPVDGRLQGVEPPPQVSSTMASPPSCFIISTSRVAMSSRSSMYLRPARLMPRP